jgi:WD40 repeat protein
MRASNIGLIASIILLAACRPGEMTPQSGYMAAEAGTLTRAASPAEVEATSFAGLEKTPGEDQDHPEPTTTQIDISTVTPTPVITTTETISTQETMAEMPTAGLEAIPEISTTVTISIASVVTQTWTFTDVVVIRSGKAHHFAWNDDGTSFAVATTVGLFLYDTDTLEMRRSFNVGESVQSVAFSPDEGLLVSGGLNGDIQWNIPETGKYLATFKDHLLGITDLAFPSHSYYLVSGSDDGTVRAWSPSVVFNPALTESPPMNVWRMVDRVTSVAMDLQLVVAGSYQTVDIWDINTGEPVLSLAGLAGWVNDVTLSPNGRILAVADASNHIRLWDTTTWELTHNVQLDQYDQITALGFNPDSMMLALGGKKGAFSVWDISANTIMDPLERYDHSIVDIAFHPSGLFLMACYENGLLRLWSIPPR